MKSLLATVATLLVERGFQIAAGIAIAGMAARALGPEGFGLLQYIQSLVFVASAVALVCGAEVVVPRLSRTLSSARQHSLMAHAFVLRLLGACAGYAALVIAGACTAPAGAGTATVLIASVLGISILLREPFGVVIAWAQANGRMQAMAYQSVCALLVKLFAIVLAYALGRLTLLVLATCIAVESALVAAFAWRHYRRQTGPWGKINAEPAILRELAFQGSVYFIGLCGQLIFKRLDQLMLKAAVPLDDLGRYAAAIQLADNVTLAATIVAATLGPRLIYAEPNLVRARGNLLRLCVGMFAMGSGAALIMWFAAGPIVRAIYGNAFSGAARLLQLAALIVPWVYLETGLNLALLREGKAWWVAAKWVLAAFAAFLVNRWGIAAYGTPGALMGLAGGIACAVLVDLAWLFQRGRR